MADSATHHSRLNRKIIDCDRCPRLRVYCEKIGQTRRAAFRDCDYWARPVPNFGDPAARLLIIGLAPAAHGANRTGRMFTGDRSGDFLYAALHRAGLANQGQCDDADDGLKLKNVMITAACHCAPPANKPSADELAACAGWLDQTLAMLGGPAVVLNLGKIAHDAMLRHLKQRGVIDRLSAHGFAHAAEHRVTEHLTLLCSYHPSQQNTFTGRLTEAMFDKVLQRAVELTRCRSAPLHPTP